MSHPVSDPTSQSVTSTGAQNYATRVSQETVAEMKALANIILSSVEQIEADATANSFTLPSPNSTFTLESETPRLHPSILSAGSTITSAAAQLVTLVRPAPLTLIDTTLQFHVCTALRTAISMHVAEILRDAGPKGKHVSEIVKLTKVHPGKLARVLRLLATNHIFTEVTPDVFANNRLSSVLDTGKPVEKLLASPESKHIETLGITSLIEHVLDENFKSSSYLTETLLDPELGHASESNKTAFNKAFNCKDDIWTWAAEPENRSRIPRFSAAQNGLKNMSSPEAILEGYNWGQLTEGSVIVDVGGGIGAQSMLLALHHPHLRFVVQDRMFVGGAVEYWEKNMPNALESGRVKLQVQNFFEPQLALQEDVSVFLLARVLHDWADDYCLKILKHLRAAAVPKTQLVIVEQAMLHVCDEPAAREIPGAELPVPPKPLLRNMGRAASGAYSTDLMMMSFFNGQERTITDLCNLLQQAGWKVTTVHVDSPSAIRFQKVVAVPF